MTDESQPINTTPETPVQPTPTEAPIVAPIVDTPTVPLMNTETIPDPVVPVVEAKAEPEATFAAPNPKVELTLKTTTILDSKPKNVISVPFILSGAESVEKAKETISGIPEENRDKYFQQEWVQSVNSASMSFVSNGIFDKRLNAEGALWKQYVEHEGVKLRIAKPTVGSGTESGQKLTGDKALMKIRAVTGMGAFLQVPLWHSGIWVLLKAPTDSDLFMLEQRIQHEKSILGLSTNGIIFSNMSAYIMDYLTTFVLDNVVESTVKDSSIEKLKTLIRVTDIPTLLWGMVSTIYPNGYPFAHACVDYPSNCQHIMHTTINIPRLLWTDTSALTKEQRKHMANRKAVYTESEILAYQEMSEWGSAKPVSISDSLRITLKVPTIREYISAGYKWISEINSTIDNVLNNAMSSSERRDYVAKQSILTMARQYSHWVSRIVGVEETDDGQKDFVIEDQDTMDEVMSTFAGDVTLLDSFLSKIIDYIEDSTIAVVAIPRIACPSCGKPMSEEYSKHPNLQILNIDQVFFTLRLQRLSLTGILNYEE